MSISKKTTSTKELDWYIEDTRERVELCHNQKPLSVYSSFNYSSSPSLIGSHCREIAVSIHRTEYQQQPNAATYLWLHCGANLPAKEAICQLANMRWGVHKTEEELGFVGHKFDIVAASAKPSQSSQPLVTTFTVKFVGDKRWHHAIPIYSLLLTDLRRYFRANRLARRLPRSLTHRLLTAHGVRKVFGGNPAADWHGYHGYNGRYSYEYRLKYHLPGKREELGIVHEGNRRWAVKK